VTVRLARALALIVWIGAALALLPPAARADGIEVRAARLEPAAEGWQLAADFGLTLPARLEEAVNRGVMLHFVVEFELIRPRWYWFDESVASATLTYRLSYHALTRQYRLALSGIAQSFPELSDALGVMSRVRGWRVLEPDQVRPGAQYEAQVRLRLDTAQLPKPFQVNALTNREWTLSSEWKRFRFNPETTKSAP
jgi:hypothetical protein